PGDGKTTLENVRIFGKRRGYTQRKNIERTPSKPLRTRTLRGRTRGQNETTLFTDGSTKRNGWENSQAGIGCWHKEGSDKNIAMKLTGNTQTNQRAELAAILAALQRNRNTPLIIKSDSLTSVKAICYKLNEWEDTGWHKVKNVDILMNILDELRTRPTPCSFQWVKAHADNEDNNRADGLANEGRISETIFEIPEMGPETSRAIHDGARLCKLTMKTAYEEMIARKILKKEKIRHPEYLEDAKELIEKETGLRPPTESMIKGIWKSPPQSSLSLFFAFSCRFCEVSNLSASHDFVTCSQRELRRYFSGSDFGICWSFIALLFLAFQIAHTDIVTSILALSA
ncbi:12591_t:CDS:1, partial [Acaulospora colombiana]